MSTLAEIEAAVEALSLKEKQKLLLFLAARVNGSERATQSDLSAFAGAIRLAEDPLESVRSDRK